MDSKIRIDKVFRSKAYIFYYLLIGVVIFAIMRPNNDVPGALRVAILGLTLLPAFFRIEFLPFALVCFQGISANSFTPVLPTSCVYYLAIVTAFYAFYKEKSRFIVGALSFLLYFFVCCLIHSDIQVFLGWILVATMLSDYIRDKSDIENLLYAFMIISLFLSILFLVYREDFIEVYKRFDEEAERSSWINSNIFGGVIAAGGVLSVAYLTDALQLVRTRELQLLSIATVLLSFPVLALNASRGAFLAFVVPSVIMLLLSQLKLIYKVLFVVAVLFFVFWLYVSTDFFDLLLMRMADESFETGGNRTVIWKEKLHSFFRDNNVLHHVFGIGRTANIQLANRMSTHNDFLTAFIGYGIIGLILFISFFVLPVIKARKETKIVVGMLTLYMLIECFVLEPVFRGYFFFIMFYFFTLKYAIIDLDEMEDEFESVDELEEEPV